MQKWAEGSIRLIDLHTDRILSLNEAGEYSFEVDDPVADEEPASSTKSS